MCLHKGGVIKKFLFNLASDRLSVCNFNFPRTRSHEQLHFFYAYLFIVTLPWVSVWAAVYDHYTGYFYSMLS